MRTQLDIDVAKKVFGWGDSIVSHFPHQLVPPEFALSANTNYGIRKAIIVKIIPAYSTDILAASQIDQFMANVQMRWFGNLKESYILELMRLCCPPTKTVQDWSITCMSDNNWIHRHFQTHELFALLTATPEQKCIAALKVIEKYGDYITKRP